MSGHYTLHLSIELAQPVDPQADATLRYLVVGDGPAPDAWPEHAFFAMERVGVELRPLPQVYAASPSGDWVAAYWQDAIGPRAGVTLKLPGLKDLQGWYEALVFADWLCALASGDGFVGYIQDEQSRSAKSLLCVRGQALYLRDESNASDRWFCLRTGEPLAPLPL